MAEPRAFPARSVRRFGRSDRVREQKQTEPDKLRRYREKIRRVERELQNAREESKILSQRVIAIQEEERRRIARDLHDDLSQSLGSMAIEAGLLVRDLSTHSSEIHSLEIRNTAESVRQKLVELSKRVHTLSRQLHPSIVRDHGLEASITSACRDVEQRDGVKIDFHSLHLPDTIPDEVALGLYRITQECLRNIVKHSETKRATVRLVGLGTGIRITIADSGVGFEPELRSQPGVGLYSIRERIALLGGRISIRTRPGCGTTIEAFTPIRSTTS